MIFSRADGCGQKYYSLWSQLFLRKNEYFYLLEKTQKGGLDITEWILWFLNCLLDAFYEAELIHQKVISKAKFWDKHFSVLINDRQRLMINNLLEGFSEKITSSKWANISNCSSDTALRDIQYLIEKNILCKVSGGGRSTSYELCAFYS